jgi:hypothetical protein
MVESSPRLLSWFHPFTFKRFHVLLNSLFKVLCNFPSRYLFAIGFTEIFSLSSSLRAALGCTLKQPDSIMPRLAQGTGDTAMGLPPTLGKSPCQRNLRISVQEASTLAFTQHRLYPRKGEAFALGCSLFTRRY